MKALLDPQDRGRQFVVTYLSKLAGTRVSGFLMTRQMPSGKWGITTYAVTQVIELANTTATAGTHGN